MRQRELFPEDGVHSERSGSDKSPGVSLHIVYLGFAFLFSLLAFLVYMLWDFGIAGRVMLFLVLVLVLVHFAIYLSKWILDQHWPRR